ncbi:MAG TPA: hypothetical protein VEK15_10790 [Vicinamibacteria bacterium]|nr:hypothetical protein [Vicinamibacteria bacterium]
MGKKGRLIVAVTFAVPLAYFAWEWYLSPQARVTRTLKAAAAAAEETDLDTFLSFVSSSYSDFVHPDRETLEDRVRSSFDEVDRFNVTLSNIKVQHSEEEATAELDVVIVAVRGEERYVVLGSPFDPERLAARLVKEDGWKIAGVERPEASALDPER